MIEVKAGAGLHLTAGAWSATLSGKGRLADVRFRGVEVVRSLLVVVRDQDWGTVPASTEVLESRVTEDGFEVALRTVHGDDDEKFQWTGRIVGSASSGLRYEFEGTALRSFLRNRIGFVVLHPLRLSGAACRIMHPDGTETESMFPVDVSPHQPFLNIASMQHDAVPGHPMAITFEGEVFETEDQRNWSDASFKTYGTPLALPFPVRIEQGERVAQAVTLAAAPLDAAPAAEDGTITVSVGRSGAQQWPRIGVGLAPELEVSDAIVRRLRPSHLRVDLELGAGGLDGVGELRRAAATGIPLELGITVADEDFDAAALDAVRELGCGVVSVIVYSADRPTTSLRSFTAVKEALASTGTQAAFLAGTDANFAELNRNPVPADRFGADAVAFSLNPQVHDDDDLSIMQTVEALDAMVQTARLRCRSEAVTVSPVTLKPRRNVYSTSAQVGATAPPSDERQGEAFTAAWTVGVLAALGRAGVRSVTLFEHAGDRGLTADPGEPAYPVFEVLAPVTDAAHWIPSTVSETSLAAALAFETPSGRRTVVVANLTPFPRRIEVVGLGGRTTVELGPYGTAVVSDQVSFEGGTR